MLYYGAWMVGTNTYDPNASTNVLFEHRGIRMMVGSWSTPFGNHLSDEELVKAPSR